MKTLRQFFQDVHFIALNVSAISLFLSSGPIATQLCEEDRDLLRNYRRYQPRAKKAIKQDFSAAE